MATLKILWGTTAEGARVAAPFFSLSIVPTRKQIVRLLKKANFVTCNDIAYKIASFNVSKSVPEWQSILLLKAEGRFDLRFPMPMLMKARVIDNTQLVIEDDVLVFFRQVPLEIDVTKSKTGEA